jgi:uncharacterized coiled-coil protein SlyX
LAELERKVQKMSATLQQIVDEVATQKTVVDGLQAFVDGLRAQIGGIPGITPEDQAKIDAIFSAVDANTQTVSKALLVNTPPAPVPTGPVPPVV